MPWVHEANAQVNSESRYPEIIAVSLLLCVAMLTVVIGRATFRRKVLGWDDYVVFLAAAFSVAYTSMTVVQTRYGLGLPIAHRPAETARAFAILSYAGKPWYQLTLGAYKLALCLGYLRFVEGTSFTRYRWFIAGSAAFCVVTQLVFVLINLLNCLPIEKSFDHDGPGTCLPFIQVQYPMASIGVFEDVLVFLLPIPLFLKLSIDGAALIGLVFLFSCGLVTTICGIVRAVYLNQVGPEGTGDNTMVVLMGCIEANVGIIMASLPFLRAFFNNVFDTVRKRTILGRRSGRSGRAEDYSMEVYAKSTEKDGIVTQVRGPQSRRDQRRSFSGSEEAILAHEASPPSSQGIVKTTSYQVRSDDHHKGYGVMDDG